MTYPAALGPVPLMLDDVDYDLPAAAVAQTPLAQRDRSRLLVDRGAGAAADHRLVRDLPELLGSGDLVVVNDTRVLLARLKLRRSSGGAAEILLLEERGGGSWEALARPSRRLRPGEVLVPDADVGREARDGEDDAESGAHADGDDAARDATPGRRVGLTVIMGEDLGEGRWIVELEVAVCGPVEARGSQGAATTRCPDAAVALVDALAAVGEVPLPPYISGPIDDPERYQTVYGRRPVSAAAPTAGLHLTLGLLNRVRATGAGIAAVELAIGVDTFRPIVAERIDDHVMHTERYRIPASTVEAVESARRVVAVGTTVVRALETFAVTGEARGRSGLFIRRPFAWRVVDLLMTNFHLPRSSLLCLVDAFVGARWRELYTQALASGYRFLSFGDAMLLTRTR